MRAPLRIGLDFDNTIVRYDELFHRVALERGLIPADLPANKGAVRDFLRKAGREDAWTEMQGYVYGPRMSEAAMFPGVFDFLQFCRDSGITTFIISHKTRKPYLGPAYDLHQAALDWIAAQGFYDPARGGLAREHVFFELTKEAKLQRIAAAGCAAFIDDLPEFLAEPAFPPGTRKILFDPTGSVTPPRDQTPIRSWADAIGLVGNILERHD